MKASTARKIARAQAQVDAQAQRHVVGVETIRQTGHFFVSIAQGSPEHAAALVALIAGAAAKIGGASLKTSQDEQSQAIGQVLDQTGSGFWAIAAVNEVGAAAQDIAAIFGKERPPVAYQVDAGAAGSVSQSTTSSLGGALAGAGAGALAGAGLAAGATALAGPAADAAAAAAAAAALAAQQTAANAISQEARDKLNTYVPPVVRDAAAAAATAATSPAYPGGTGPSHVVDSLIEVGKNLVPGVGLLNTLTGGKTAGEPVPFGYVDGQPYYTEPAFREAQAVFLARKHGGR